MEELWLDGHRIDLPSKTVSQTLQINDLAELKNRQANYTNRFKVSMTPNNTKVFQYLGITGNTSRKPYEKISAKLVIDGIELISSGYAQVKDTNKNYEVVIYDGNISLYEELKGKRINGLDYQDLNHYLNLQSYEDSFSKTEGYIYGIGDFGYSSTNSYINIERQAPSLFIHTIWNKIFTEAGFTYSGDFFINDENFLNEVITPTKGYDVVDSTTSSVALGSVNTNTINRFEHSHNNHISYDDLFSLTAVSSLNNIQVISIVDDHYIKVGFDGILRINLGINYSLQDGNANIKIKLNNSVISYSSLIQGNNETITKQLNLNVSENDEIRVEMFSSTRFGPEQEEGEPDFYELNVTASCTMSLASITGGQLIDFKEITPETSQINFIQDIMQRYGLIFKPLKNSKHYQFVTIESLLNDRENAEDWSDKISFLDKESYSVGSYAKSNTMNYSYEEDVIEPTHNGVMSVNNENISNEKVLFTSIYKISNKSRTSHGQPIYRIPIWEWVQEDDTYVVKNKETELRIFRINRISKTIIARFFTVDNSSNITGDIPFLSLEKIQYQFYINNYYPGFNRILNAPKKRSDRFHLTPIDVYNINFFKLKYLKQLGQYFYLNKVSNFVNGKLTKCELIQVNGVTFNQPPSQLGIKELTISHGSSISLNLEYFMVDYIDPEFDNPQQIKILTFGSSDVVIKNNDVVITSETIIDANDFNLVIEDLENLIPEHTAEFDFTIQSFNNNDFSSDTGTIKVRVLERVNYTPTANAGGDKTITYDSSADSPADGTGSIYLNGGNSTDQNGDNLTYEWTMINPPSVISIANETQAVATISVNDPNGLNDGQTFDVKLKVTDPFGAFDEDTITVTLNDLSNDVT